MLDEERKSKLYECLISSEIDGSEISTKTLNEAGINSYWIKKFIDAGLLSRVKVGQYKLENSREFLNYGKSFIKEEIDKAKKCFERCYQLDSQNLGACFQCFIINVSKNNFDKAYELLSKLLITEDIDYLHDANLYLLLLSKIAEVPEDLRKTLEEIKDFGDVEVREVDARFENIVVQNDFRRALFNGDFTRALSLIKSVNGTPSVYATTTLLYKYQSQHKDRLIGQLNQLINEKKYAEILAKLREKQATGPLETGYQIDLLLCEKIIAISDSGEVPRVQEIDTDDIITAIKYNNFELAVKINSEYLSKTGAKSNPTKMLLKDILELIKNLKSPILSKSETSSGILDMIRGKKYGETIKKLQDEQATGPLNKYNQIVLLLCEKIKAISDSGEVPSVQAIDTNDITTAISCNNYKLAYQINEEILTKKGFTTNTIKMLLDDILELIKSLSQNLSQGETEPEVLINPAIKFRRGGIIISHSEASEILKGMARSSSLELDEGIDVEEIPSKPINPESIKPIVVEAADEKPAVVKPATPLPGAIELQPVVSSEALERSFEKIPTVTLSKTAKEKFKEKIKIAISRVTPNNPIEVTDPMTEEEKNIIFNIACNYPQISMISFYDENNNLRIALQYNTLSPNDDINLLRNEAKNRFFSKDYWDCINLNLKLICDPNNQDREPYRVLGLLYLESGKTKLALDCFRIANINGDQRFDFREKIHFLENPFEQPREMSQRINLKSIFISADEYMKKNGANLEDACTALGYSRRVCDLLRFEYAKLYLQLDKLDEAEALLNSISNPPREVLAYLEILKQKRDKVKSIILPPFDSILPTKN